jgi:amino acid transporter
MAEAVAGKVPPPEEQQLKKGVLTTWDALALSIAVIAPAMAASYNTSGSAAVSGGSTPLCFLIAGLSSLALAYVVIQFTRRMASAGYAYTYTTKSLGPTVGFIIGWLYTFGFALFVPMTMAGASYYLGILLNSLFGWNIHWFIFFIIGMAGIFLLSYYDIRISTRSQLVFGAVSVLVLAVLAVMIIARGGRYGNDLSAFGWSHTIGKNGAFYGIAYGIIFAVVSFIGFETSAVLGEETNNPRRAIPTSIVGAVIFAVIFYLLMTYAISIGFGVTNGTTWAQNPTPLHTLSKTFAPGLTVLADLAAIISAYIVCLACHNATIRVMFAMGRDGALPRFLGRTHPIHKTPVGAIVVNIVLATILAIIVGFPVVPQLGLPGGPTGPTVVYFFLGGTGGIAVSVVYVVLAISGIVYFRREMGREYSALKHVVVPIIAIVAYALGIYGSIYPGSAPSAPYSFMGLLTATWIVIGIGVVLYLRAKSPELVGRLGQALGEEGGSEAEAGLA